MVRSILRRELERVGGDGGHANPSHRTGAASLTSNATIRTLSNLPRGEHRCGLSLPTATEHGTKQAHPDRAHSPEISAEKRHLTDRLELRASPSAHAHLHRHGCRSVGSHAVGSTNLVSHSLASFRVQLAWFPVSSGNGAALSFREPYRKQCACTIRAGSPRHSFTSSARYITSVVPVPDHTKGINRGGTYHQPRTRKSSDECGRRLKSIFARWRIRDPPR